MSERGRNDRDDGGKFPSRNRLCLLPPRPYDSLSISTTHPPPSPTMPDASMIDSTAPTSSKTEGKPSSTVSDYTILLSSSSSLSSSSLSLLANHSVHCRRTSRSITPESSGTTLGTSVHDEGIEKFTSITTQTRIKGRELGRSHQEWQHVSKR